MAFSNALKPIEILLVEDNLGDADLALDAFAHSKLNNRLHVVGDGETAIAFLYKKPPYENVPRPDLILLDLNIPKKDGREVLSEIKENPDLKRIPVVVLTSSQAEEDILNTYSLHANCYLTKPLHVDHFFKLVRSIEKFWLGIVVLPPKGDD